MNSPMLVIKSDGSKVTIDLDKIHIMVDNAAAITIAADGGNWRTRCFAAKGARINHKIRIGALA